MSQLTICLIIFALTVVGYCSGLYSLATISLTSMMALTLTGCLDVGEALGYFSNSTVIMIGGMCVVAAGFNRTSFCMKLANGISDISKGSINKLMFGYVIIGVLLSQFIQSPLVVFGIISPMLIASAEAMNIRPSKVIFPVGVATIVTCCTLPIGAGATISTELNGYIESYGYTAHMVGFLDPMKARLPLLIISILWFALIGPKFAPDLDVNDTRKSEKRTTEAAKLSSFAEIAGIVIFFGDALALMFASNLNMQTWEICVIGALLMVLCGVLKPQEAAKAIPISMLILIAGALATAGALSATGAGDMIGDFIANLVSGLGGNSYLIGLIFFIIPFILTQFMSNRGTMLIFHPIAIATCASIGGNPVGLMILIQAACLSAFMTPMATGAVPYIMDLGGYNQAQMVKQGALFSVVACVVSVGWIMTLFPIL
ncbi:MAG: anion permease [Lachnospiraceae bacterium]|nr:anion permease [Lachnospiraceae bacterium]